VVSIIEYPSFNLNAAKKNCRAEGEEFIGVKEKQGKRFAEYRS
jgi:hypothetical protein